jgi:hypothetical protein
MHGHPIRVKVNPGLVPDRSAGYPNPFLLLLKPVGVFGRHRWQGPCRLVVLVTGDRISLGRTLICRSLSSEADRPSCRPTLLMPGMVEGQWSPFLHLLEAAHR